MIFLKLLVVVLIFCGSVFAQFDDQFGDLENLNAPAGITPEMIRRFRAMRDAQQTEIATPSPEVPALGETIMADYDMAMHYDSLYHHKVLRRFFDRDSLRKRITVYGENFFLFPMRTFKPLRGGPIPKEYRFGPGDRIEVSIWGDVRSHFFAEVRADGTIMLPHIGRINAMGMTYENLREVLVQRYTTVFSTLAGGRPNATSFLDLNLSKMRMIKVYVLGEALNPGTYDLLGMSDVYSAIYFSGGPSPEGSFRDIRLVREGVVLDTIDLYEFIIDGKINREFRLEDGDAIVFGPRGNLVEIEGAVLRPLQYELKPGETLGDLLRLSGGLRGNAFIENVVISRYIEFMEREGRRGDREVINLTFSTVEEVLNSDFQLRDLDHVSIRHLGGDLDNHVEITGSPVRYPGSFGLTQELQTLNDLLEHAGGLRDDHYKKASVFRKTPDRRFSLFTHNFETDEDFTLHPDDSIHIFSKHEIEIRPPITISGEVNRPQSVPFFEGMRLSDALLLAEGVTYDADRGFVEINRREGDDLDIFNIVSNIEIDENLKIVRGEDYLLRPHDVIIVRKNPNYEMDMSVHLTGSVLYPGKYYLISNSETLVDLIRRAGGVRRDGNIGAASFHRDNQRLSIDVAEAYANPSHRNNILLLRGDSIHIPRMDMTVQVSGQVFFPSKVVWQPGRNAEYYINQAGGLKKMGDRRRIVAFKGNGQRAISRTCWFDDRLDPGSKIYVPTRTEADLTRHLETLRIFRESIGIISTAASLVVTYYTIRALQQDN